MPGLTVTSLNVRSCPLCSSAHCTSVGDIAASDIVRVNPTYRDDALTRLSVDPQSRWPIVECDTCQFLYAQLLPPDTFLRAVYDEAIDPKKAETFSLSPGWIAFQVSTAVNVLKLLPWDPSVPRIHRLLDFGCGYGSLVESLNSDYLSCVGFETSLTRLERHRLRNLQTYADWEEIVRVGKYSAAFACEVLEHVANPKEVLMSIRSVLQPHGILAVTVPNFSHARMKDQLRRATSSKEFSTEVNPWEHLNYFSPQHLKGLLKECGFCEIEFAVDVGLRPGLSGARRIGNCLKSSIRLIQYALKRHQGTTQMIARVSE